MCPHGGPGWPALWTLNNEVGLAAGQEWGMWVREDRLGMLRFKTKFHKHSQGLFPSSVKEKNQQFFKSCFKNSVTHIPG